MNFTDSKAIYLQLADRIMDSVAGGAMMPGGRIPSVREFAAEVEVNPNTVVRTYDWLESHDIVFNRRGLGYFVAENAPRKIMEMRREVFYADELPRFFDRIASFGWTSSELAKEFESYLKSKQK